MCKKMAFALSNLDPPGCAEALDTGLGLISELGGYAGVPNPEDLGTALLALNDCWFSGSRSSSHLMIPF